MRVCPETIYQWSYADKRRRKGHDRRVSRFPTPGRVPISERSPTNCWNYRTDKGAALLNRQRARHHLIALRASFRIP